MPRTRPISRPVTLWLDDEPVEAEEGEPVAVALVAAGHLALARSPKFHRPRGPSCLRGACDGCLARVDGIPNVMTCRVAAFEGLRIERQNVVGWREHDVLRVTDWFFARGMDHHELMAGVPVVQRAVEGLARQIAGLGRLPNRPADRPRPATRAERRSVDVLVVGAGPAGMAAAVEWVRRGRVVEVLEDDWTWGRTARILADSGPSTEPSSGSEWEALLASVEHSLRSSPSLKLRVRSTVLGIYGDDVLCSTPEGLEVLTARVLVLAPGTHDGVVAFEGNDRPGVMSARAACALQSHGATPGDHVVVVVTERGDPSSFGAAYARMDPNATLVHGTPLRTRGGARVRAVTVKTPEGDRELSCDAVVVDAPRAPSYELAAQAGARLSHDPRGFKVESGRGSAIAPHVYVVGEAAGTALDPAAIAAEAAAMGT